MDFGYISKSDGHAVAIDGAGNAFTWSIAKFGNRFGQLARGQNVTEADAATPARVPLPTKVSAAWAGGGRDAGHTALLGVDGTLWLAGCDRWQQLGLCDPSSGATGYTWRDGASKRAAPAACAGVAAAMRRADPDGGGGGVRDVALGNDHTVVLAANQRDVVAFGRGQHGQLGLDAAGQSKPFVSAPAVARGLGARDESGGGERGGASAIAAVCAAGDCTATLDARGTVLRRAGRCKGVDEALRACVAGARARGLLGEQEERGGGGRGPTPAPSAAAAAAADGAR